VSVADYAEGEFFFDFATVPDYEARQEAQSAQRLPSENAKHEREHVL
jgi:hypothetical protein